MDRVEIYPTLTGAHGRAWPIDLAEMRRRYQAGNPDDTTIGAYIVEAPYAHGVWHSYFIAMIHLRDVPGQSKPPTINRPNATHEIMVAALDPNTPRTPAISGHERPKYLTPFNFIGQLVCANDAEAKDILQKTVSDVTDARLNPDTDYIKFWAKRFGEFCLKPGWDRGTVLQAGGVEVVIPPFEPPTGDTRKLH